MRRSVAALGLRRPARSSVSPDERRARRLVYARSGGQCEMAGLRCLGEAAEWHHRKNRSQGGEWLPSNGLHLCVVCHQWVTDHPAGARLMGWSVPSHRDSGLIAVRRRHDWVLLDDEGGFRPCKPLPVGLVS